MYKPESTRLRRHLSAVVNFAKFREEKLVAYTEMQAHIDALLEERRVLEEDNLSKVPGCWAAGFGAAGFGAAWVPPGRRLVLRAARDAQPVY